MQMLSMSALLLYIYKRNCEKEHPTAIPMSDFCAEFPSATREAIEEELNNLRKDDLMRNKTSVIYDLTEAGLEEVERLMTFAK